MNFSRGRGRGRGSNNQNQNNAVQSPWSSTTKTLASTGTVRPGHKKENLENKNRMIDMQSRYGKILDDMEASDSSDEEIHNEQIISKLTKNFDSSLDGVEEIHQSQMVQDILQTGAICCLVCIETVKRLNAIWSCTKCFSIFHLQCIQKWAREGIGRQAIQAEGDLRDVKFMWNCPKCRHEYSQNENPTKYMCYCGKEEDPPFDPWIVPHSCGNKCERLLQPECGHECLLLCHPGACPPCPKTIKSKCYCGKSSPVLKRCSQKFWSCGNVCGQKLPCGQHVCEQVCHSGECPPCPKTSEKKCMCGKKKAIRKCAENVWSCQQACNKALSCDHHVCEKECHSEDCGDCPRGGNRFCPCGKTEIQLPCTEDVNTCVDTCMKPLNCQLHKCSKKCHFGSCESCLQVVEKSCRCGKKKKLVPCSQPLICESKCTKTRNCGRHPCKKKCCNGSCPPCEQVCNRNLNCRNHKCPSPCHQGLCYPCPESKKVTCFCGSNSITTPCGKEKSVKPPRCKKQCTIPSDCHHEKREVISFHDLIDFWSSA
ncbi:NF-X1-type zinc finger protein NFXL1-like [Clytia hemisphaerica]|uniref:NF-X1-type zinc finger protein NFXL1 n=1 Tax=Clytia hemisphaerica TaxID=252671 RepID=A0A7M5XPW6_9CNID